jgi:predicted small lipoprotein YifL
MRFCWGQYALWAVIAVLAIMSMLGGCGARGDLYLPQDSEQQQQR